MLEKKSEKSGNLASARDYQKNVKENVDLCFSNHAIFKYGRKTGKETNNAHTGIVGLHFL